MPDTPTTPDELATATRAELQQYLEARGFAVYESEDVEDLRTAAILVRTAAILDAEDQ